MKRMVFVLKFQMNFSVHFSSSHLNIMEKLYINKTYIKRSKQKSLYFQSRDTFSYLQMMIRIRSYSEL